MMDEQWLDVCSVDKLPNGARSIIEHEDKRILVVNIDAQYFAIESLCTHAMFDLDDADIEDCQIICPLHGAHFCLRTGKVLSPPAFEDIPSYETRTQNGQIQVKLVDV